LIVALTIIFFTGVKDDILILVAKKKLLSQTLAACVVIHWGGVKLTSLYGLFGIYGIPEWASYFLSFATVLGLINSFNLIDGVDLLAGSLGCLSILFFSSWLMTYVDVAWGVLGFSAIGAILGFLIYNRPPAKIFMGDTGAMIIGLLVAVLTIKFVEANRLQTIIRSGPSIAFAAICVPVFDTLRLIIVRVMQGQSPFCADKNHIHHLLLNCGFNHLQVTLTLLSLNFGLLLFAYNFDYFKIEGRWASEVLLSILISVYGIFVSVVSKTSAREKNTTTS
jgi:UDP-N-acetylmuramyl pentapeptide phosphotransferase/UDP-N-acetylglucosamine-1-phosphate transferase